MSIRSTDNPTLSEIQAALEVLKAARLNKQFIISKDALYDYYSTNSGIIASNSSIASGGGGGGGGDEPSDLEGRVEALEDEMAGVKSGVTTANSNAAEAIATSQDAAADANTAIEAVGEVHGIATDAKNAAEEAQTTTKKTKRAFSNAVDMLSTVEDEIPKYTDIDMITDATITLKHAISSINDELNDSSEP